MNISINDEANLHVDYLDDFESWSLSEIPLTAEPALPASEPNRFRCIETPHMHFMYVDTEEVVIAVVTPTSTTIVDGDRAKRWLAELQEEL